MYGYFNRNFISAENPQLFGQDLWGEQGPVLPLAPFEKIISVTS